MRTALTPPPITDLWRFLRPTDPCSYCGAPADVFDHVVPRAYGGTDDRANLTPACGPCNRHKADQPAATFRLTDREKVAWLLARGWWRHTGGWRSPDRDDWATYSTAAACRREAFVRARRTHPAPVAARFASTTTGPCAGCGRRDHERYGPNGRALCDACAARRGVDRITAAVAV